MKKKNYDETVKILMLGESGINQNDSLFEYSRCWEEQFIISIYWWQIFKSFHNYAWVSNIFNVLTDFSVEYKQKIHSINGKKVLIQVWDTAGLFEILINDYVGQEKFRTITPSKRW